MKYKYSIYLAMIIIIILCILIVLETIKMFKNQYEQGYIDACKDFYQGQLKYDLVTNSDGTREWKKLNR